MKFRFNFQQSLKKKYMQLIPGFWDYFMHRSAFYGYFGNFQNASQRTIMFRGMLSRSVLHNFSVWCPTVFKSIFHSITQNQDFNLPSLKALQHYQNENCLAMWKFVLVLWHRHTFKVASCTEYWSAIRFWFYVGYTPTETSGKVRQKFFLRVHVLVFKWQESFACRRENISDDKRLEQLVQHHPGKVMNHRILSKIQSIWPCWFQIYKSLYY